jgi:hypothetical protein
MTGFPASVEAQSPFALGLVLPGRRLTNAEPCVDQCGVSEQAQIANARHKDERLPFPVPLATSECECHNAALAQPVDDLDGPFPRQLALTESAAIGGPHLCVGIILNVVGLFHRLLLLNKPTLGPAVLVCQVAK